ncbi:uncharacterized protein BDR25DRAFT_310938 [Lindgomyces ingoldianus]|uniref:Uncharacterized protein n=1 Tax=Lindgomyces ingoldianus TaxID=673940 RepID=A0ACB6R8J8_9PLEO|nr:uncharacterized protein BDR25DRAFT_310938 [Lindgomyces ingoldianus]KAF2475589.1 hypothetical protein BDR25DRAFT_310938 [Lindgomyces ingoldianus]
MASAVGDYLFSKLAEAGVKRVLGYSRGSIFIGSVQRNGLDYEDLNHMHSNPGPSEIGAFVVSAEEGELTACCNQGTNYFSYRPVVYVVEHASAQFCDLSQLTSRYGFATSTILSSPITVVSQISRILDTMLYESKPVYIGLSLAVAGQPMPAPSPSASHPPSLDYPTGSAPTSMSTPSSLVPPLGGTPGLASHTASRAHSSEPPPSADEEEAAKAAIAMSFI